MLNSRTKNKHTIYIYIYIYSVCSHAQTHQKVTNISVDTRVPLVVQMAKMAANSLLFKVVNKIIRSSHLLFESSPVRNYRLQS